MAEPFRLLVAGWRYATTEHHGTQIRDRLTPYWLRYNTNVVLVHGQCPYGGGDLICEQIGLAWGWTPERHPAQRDHHGRLLGPARNTLMVTLGADEVEAFPLAGTKGRSGTWDLIHKAADGGILVHITALKPPGGGH